MGKQGAAYKGSQKWIQILVNEKPDLLDSRIRQDLKMPETEKIEWVSPLKKDGYHEYRDNFLAKLDPSLNRVKMSEFWPRRGPRWDALARSDSGKLFLVEAKSHIPELLSNTRATQESHEKIEASLNEAKEGFGSNRDFDWTKTFYQYANRLAFAWHLRESCLKAHLVFVYLLNDAEQKGPATAEEWKGAIKLLHKCLGVREGIVRKYVIDAFIDVNSINK